MARTNKDRKIVINPNKIRVRDTKIKDMITSTGGVVRVFRDKKKAVKADKVGRKQKYKEKDD
jgi:hypothetical protein